MDLTASFATGLAFLREIQGKLNGSAREGLQNEQAAASETQTGKSQYSHCGTQTDDDIPVYQEDIEPAYSPSQLEGGFRRLSSIEEETTPSIASDPTRDVPDDVEPMQEVEQQCLREQVYIELEGDTEDDYTGGPARLVAGFDGIRQCAALLMTVELSAKIKAAIEKQRQLTATEQLTECKQRAFYELEGEVKEEITNHEYRLLQNGIETNDDLKATLEEELETLGWLLESVQIRQQIAEAQIRTQTENLRICTAKVTAILADAFSVARIVEPQQEEQEIPEEYLDLQEEYKRVRRERLEETDHFTGYEDSIAEFVRTRDEDMMVERQPLTPEQEAYATARDTFYVRRDQLQRAETRFDRRALDRDLERQHSEETESEFDLRWVEQNRQLTHELADAEISFAEAKARAIAAGVDIYLDDQSSGFGDLPEDGYRESQEADIIANVPEPKIANWLASFSEEPAPDASSEADVDEWAFDDVELSDSLSMIAYGSRRRRIDRWQEACDPSRSLE